ncbi:S9 family peptidase [bacterium]|nr:S9 family peptidase [bacterium]
MRPVKMIYVIVFFMLGLSALSAQKKALTPDDIMRFKEIHHTQISRGGEWLAYAAVPGRGDGNVIVKATDGSVFYTIERGSSPVISADGRWVSAEVLPETTLKKDRQSPKGMALLSTVDGAISILPNIERCTFSADSRWLAVREGVRKDGKDKKKKSNAGRSVALFMPGRQDTLTLDYVTHFSFDSTSSYLAYAVEDTNGTGNGVYYVDLRQPEIESTVLLHRSNHSIKKLAWHHRSGSLAFSLTTPDTGDVKVVASVWIKRFKKLATDPLIINDSNLPSGWSLPGTTLLSWSEDGKRLFLGLTRPKDDTAKIPEDTSGIVNPFDQEKILEGHGVDVWHWNDEFVSTQQHKMWPRMKNKQYTAVYHPGKHKLVVLGDEDLPSVKISHHAHYLLATSDKPYRKLVTWEGSFRDVSLVNLKNGKQISVVKKISGRPAYSPDGRYVVYYDDHNWHLFDARSRITSNLTKDIAVPFANEDHDYPSDVPGYGVAGWLGKDDAVLIYDKYDIWSFNCRTGAARCLTKGQGRKDLRTFRIINTKVKNKYFKSDESLLLSFYHQMRKEHGFYSLNPEAAPELLVESEHKYSFIKKVDDADKYLYTRECYTEFPDLWIAGIAFNNPQRLTDVNPQISEYAWGKAELVDWHSSDGTPLQGILIRPGNYEEGKRYPVLVYYYRFFSQRLHEYNQMVINHRPNFPFFASNGYCVFLPDIRFDIGLPGPAATKCLVPGVQKLIDMGVADPDGICLHGHSWSGYQTAFVITQTNLFTCAIAGAPVTNMTSAYGGIRYGSGMARMFQYEKSQSRIGKTLWNGRDLYIENSPLFFADRIETPLLMMFGDEDGAVPWTQGIELYLAMRRLEKPCVFLQYRGEPHHPQKYANKLDYTIRFKEFTDHFCKGGPAPEWWSKGVPYQGK